MIGLTQQVDLDGKVVAARYLNRIKLITVRQTQQENGFSMRLDNRHQPGSAPARAPIRALRSSNNGVSGPIGRPGTNGTQPRLRS